MIIIYQGTEEDFWNKLRSEVQAEIKSSESKKIAPLTYMECYEYLGVTNKTFDKYRKEMGLTIIYPADLQRMLHLYPRLLKSHLKAKVA